MTDPAMSPAQKITAAFNDRHELCGPFDDNWQELCLAAAFREFAHEVAPVEPEPPDLPFPSVNDPWPYWDTKQAIRRELLAIAAELEAQP
jgi:hypothetical protein